MDDFVENLRRALGDLGWPDDQVAVVEKDQPRGGHGADLSVNVGGQSVAIELETVVTESDADRLVHEAHRFGDRPVMVVGDRIAWRAQERFREAGINFFDQRGRLRLVLPGIASIDAPLPGTHRGRTRAPTDPLAGEVAKEIAIVVLSDPGSLAGARPIARAIGRSPSSVHGALTQLQGAGLVSDRDEPLVPDLFWELAGRWHREPMALERVPDWHLKGLEGLELPVADGIDELPGEGWALTDTLAAQAWGMPVVPGAGTPPDFYVATSRDLLIARARLQPTPRFDDRVCTVSLPPVRLVGRRRYRRPDVPWPVADHIVVALDLAQDRARGREILEHWTPRELTRVW